MRTQEQIDKIKKTFSEPRAVSNFLLSTEIDHLVNLYESNNNYHVHKQTGPVTLDISYVLDDTVIQSLLKRIEQEIGPFEIAAGLFFRTDYPHIIHNDDTYELPNTVYKAIAMPLQLTGNVSAVPRLCFFDQYYFHGPAKFFNGDSNVIGHFNEHVYSYENVDSSVQTPFLDKTRYFTHLKPQWLNGLSLYSTLPWVPSSAIIFDSVQLHCASDFRSQGITSKLGLSIFTKRYE